ncbi:hypothetical protein GF314_14950 [bacterium]|nr:hypothetical protein [bacterium]
MPTIHCPECTGTTACGKSHVYVIELDAAAAGHGPFRDDDPAGTPPRGYLYVGMTRHKPECRFQQHRRFATGEDDFECRCFGDGEPVRRTFRDHDGHRRTGGNRLAGEFGRWLRARLHRRHNPIADPDEALQREAELADELRAQGYRVHQA